MVSHNTILGLLFFLLSISYSGATYPNNYALSFDGVNDIVKIAHMNTDLNLANFWTAEAWVKPLGNQANNFQPNIVGFPGRHPQLEFCGTSPSQCNDSTRTLAQLREYGGGWFTSIGNAVLPNTDGRTWYHIAATWNNVTFITYLNGNLDTSMLPYTRGYLAPKNCTTALCDEGLDIGGYRFVTDSGIYYSSQYFTGVIDEVRVWTVGRTQEEIRLTMNTVLSGSEPNLLYYWRFDEGQGPIVGSLSEVAYGTLGGGISGATPIWVQSDAPLTNTINPSPPTGGGGPTTPSNESGLYATASILSIVFLVGGIIVGIVGFRIYQNRAYQQLK